MENIALVTIKVRPTPRPGKPSHPSKPNSVSKMAAMTLVAVKRCVTPTQPASKRHKPVRRGESRQPTLGVKMMSAGLAACWADMVTFPLDVAKVRLQVRSCPRDALSSRFYVQFACCNFTDLFLLYNARIRQLCRSLLYSISVEC